MVFKSVGFDDVWSVAKLGVWIGGGGVRVYPLLPQPNPEKTL